MSHSNNLKDANVHTISKVHTIYSCIIDKGHIIHYIEYIRTPNNIYIYIISNSIEYYTLNLFGDNELTSFQVSPPRNYYITPRGLRRPSSAGNKSRTPVRRLAGLRNSAVTSSLEVEVTRRASYGTSRDIPCKHPPISRTHYIQTITNQATMSSDSFFYIIFHSSIANFFNATINTIAHINISINTSNYINNIGTS